MNFTFNDGMTVGDLKKLLDNAPDDFKVKYVVNNENAVCDEDVNYVDIIPEAKVVIFE